MTIDREEVEIIIRNAKRLGCLSSDLLEVSRIESKSFKIVKEPVKLNEKIQNVIKDSRSFIEENRKIKMIFRPTSHEPVVVEADKSKLFEVLSNIIRNAKFNSRRYKITDKM
jgi:signal transduction histidine kinase